MNSWLRHVLGLGALLLTFPGCGYEEASGTGFSLIDPGGALPSVTGDLGLWVFPSDGRTCDQTRGVIAAAGTELPDQAMLEGSVANLTFATDASATVNLAPAEYALLVRGRGTDTVTMRPDQIVCTGCTLAAIGAGETREVTISLVGVVGEGVCGDSVLSPDEQCDDGNEMDGDGCSAVCRAELFQVARSVGAPVGETAPSIGWASGERAVISHDSDAATDAFVMFFAPDGSIITSPSALAVSGPVESLGGAQQISSASVSAGRRLVAFSDFLGGADGGDVRALFLDENRNPLAPSTLLHASRPGTQIRPRTALAGTGAGMVTFEDSAATTGLSARFFAAGANTPSGDDSVLLGSPLTGATAPAVSGHQGGFVSVFAAGGDIYVQRWSAAGVATDAMARPVLSDASGEQAAPAVASLGDGTSLIVFTTTGPGGDGSGTGIGGVLLAADGTLSEPIPLNTTTDGDQLSPRVASGSDGFFVTFASDSQILVRNLNRDGAGILNRNAPPSTGDFAIANGSVSSPVLAVGGAPDRFLFVVFEDRRTDPAGDITGVLLPVER